MDALFDQVEQFILLAKHGPDEDQQVYGAFGGAVRHLDFQIPDALISLFLIPDSSECQGCSAQLKGITRLIFWENP